MNNEVKDAIKSLIEATDRLDKTVNSMNKTVNRMLSLCGLMLLVLFATIILAIVF